MPKINLSELRVRTGRADPLGAMVRPNGVRFAVVSRHATRVWLALFEGADDQTPAVEFEFEPERYRIGDIWSIYIHGLAAGVFYMYRMDGPCEPENGHRYDPGRYLLDPYARVVVGDVHGGRAKGLVVDEKLDWPDDVRPRIPQDELIIYETHVRGFTIDPSSGVEHGGTYLGFIQKIPYLKELGVTAVELLPIQEFGENRVGHRNPDTGEELTNYWGYNTIGFFAPTGKYASKGGLGEQQHEFRQMVAALHEAGIEVILDVVFNHTAEGTEKGPTLCFRGIDNAIYYMLDAKGGYRNFSGCGNTLNCNHPLVRDFILDCLRYWVVVMHVDGFRFDLASILGRDTQGHIVENAALIERIAEDPALRDTKLIAEAWDAGGAYQVGSFGDIRWAEWNGRYRDDVRRFWRGDADRRRHFAKRLTGSADLYQWARRTPGHSINFITAHDGFTLRDFVSYDRKHNEANGEKNADGLDENLSWNCGVEGDTNDPEVDALRRRMQKSYLATLFLSVGVPMILGGDEFGRSQRGNNNAYCQDNAISWYDWRLLEKNQDLFRFTKKTIEFRKDNPGFSRLSFFDGQPVTPGGPPDLLWFEPDGEPLDWDDDEPGLACRIDGTVNDGVPVYLMFNSSATPKQFSVPEGVWKVRINTAKEAPSDVPSADSAPVMAGLTDLVVGQKSMVVLCGQGAGDAQAAPGSSAAEAGQP